MIEKHMIDINLKMILFSKTINYPLWGVCGGSRGGQKLKITKLERKNDRLREMF